MKIRTFIETLTGHSAPSESDLKSLILATQRELDCLNALDDPDPATLEAIREKREALPALRGQLDTLTGWRKRVEQTPLPTPAQIRAVAQEAFFMVPDGVKAEVERLESQYQKELSAMLQYIPRRATEAYQAHAAAIQSAIENGESADTREGWSQSDWEDDYRLKLGAHKAALKRLGVECHELVSPYMEAFDASVAEFADQREQAERSLCETFGLKWEPSNVLLLLHKVRISVRATFESFHPGSGLSPRSVAAFILD